MHIARVGERLPRLQIQFRISRSFRPQNLANLGSKIRFWIRRKEHTLLSLKMLNVDHLGCADSVPLSDSKNGFLIRDLPDFAVERNVKSEIGFVTLVTFRKRVQYA